MPVADLLLLTTSGAACLAFLVWWQRRDGARPDQWANDSKNIMLCLTVLERPHDYTRDFLFKHGIKQDFYMPLAVWVMRRLTRLTGSLERAVALLHALLAALFCILWPALAYRLTGSAPAAAASLFLGLPVLCTLPGDTVCGPLPGNWTPRFWGNIGNLLFLLLLLAAMDRPPLVLAAALLAGALFHVHPVAGIGCSLLLAVGMLHGLREHTLPLTWALCAIALDTAAALPMVITYFRSTGPPPVGNRLPTDQFNAIARGRFHLWPYPASVLGRLFLGPGQLVLGGAYLTASVWLFLADTPLVWQGALNMMFLTVILNRNEPFGYVVLTFAWLGLIPPQGTALALSAVILLAVAWVYRYRRYSWQPILALAGPILGLISMLAGAKPVLPPSAAAFLFVWSPPLVLLVSLGGACLFHWLLPRWAGWRITLLDIGRVLKFVLYPLYFLALLGVLVLTESLLSEHWPLVLWGMTGLLVLAWCCWRHNRGYLAVGEDPDDLAVFDWVRTHLPPNALCHVISTRLPRHDPKDPTSSSFGFRFRSLTLRPITGCWKDAGIAFMWQPETFKEWADLMAETRRLLEQPDLNAFLAQARSRDADYLVLSKGLAGNNDSHQKQLAGIVNHYCIYKI
ncbi:MAG: hypothetical protein V2A77_03910 [Pseudomonadota bacterium]